MIIGQYHNTTLLLSAVESYRRLPKSRIQVTLRGGDTEVYDANAIETALENTIQASFPAEGAKLIEVWEDENGRPEKIGYRTILGFVIDATGATHAVTMDGNSTDPVVLFADGHVEAFEQEWETADAFLADKMKAFDERKATATMPELAKEESL